MNLHSKKNNYHKNGNIAEQYTHGDIRRRRVLQSCTWHQGLVCVYTLLDCISFLEDSDLHNVRRYQTTCMPISPTSATIN